MRSNEQWLTDLGSVGPGQAAALEDLRAILLRASLLTYQRNLSDVSGLNGAEIEKLAEDCAQDALLAILARLSDFRGDSKFTTWAYKFAVNIALSTARRERWKGRSLDELEPENISFDRFFGLSQRDATPLQSVLQDEALIVIRDVIQNELTERQRMVLKWMVFDEVPMDVVAERLNTNRNALYKALHDTRAKLKQRLEARGFEHVELIGLFDAGR